MIRSQSTPVFNNTGESQDVNHPLQGLDSSSFSNNSAPPLSQSTFSNELSGAAASRTKLSADDVTQDLEGIKRLMKNDCWRSALKLADRLLGNAKYPHDKLQCKTCKIIAQLKMRMYKSAQDELDSLGDFELHEYWYETYPDLYPKLKGSMVPFLLRVIKAELPFNLKTTSGLTGLDNYYELLNMCRKEIASFKLNKSTLESKMQSKPTFADSVTVIPYPSAPMNLININSLVEEFYMGSFTDVLSVWEYREQLVILSIISHLLQEKEHPLAISLLQDVVQKNPTNCSLLASLARIHLQLGNVKMAGAIFKQIESLVTHPDKSVLCLMNRGFAALAMDQYNVAIDHFQSVLNIDPNNIVAANNKAICLLYKTDLTGAISLLEEVIRRDPERNLHETIVFNLCTLYDLKTDNSTEKKRSIMNLVAKFGSDSFDFSVLKLT